MSHKKIILRNNSHSLSEFQSCGMMYNYTMNEWLGRRGGHLPFIKGAFMHLILGAYDEFRHMQHNSHVDSLAVANKTFTDNVNKSPNDELNVADKALVYSTYQEYLEFYKEETRIVHGIELGFSKVLYEDANFIFIYEGSIDVLEDHPMLSNSSRLEIVPMDRKTRSRNEDYYPYSNQFMGYCWGAGSNKFIIDYIGYQKSLPPHEKFVRKWYPVSQAQIDQWRKDTIWWYFQQLAAIKTHNYHRTRASCHTKWGKCKFHKICDAPTKVGKDFVKLTDFTRVKPHVSWELKGL